MAKVWVYDHRHTLDYDDVDILLYKNVKAQSYPEFHGDHPLFQ